MIVCPRCGSDNPHYAKRCGACGLAFGEPAPSAADSPAAGGTESSPAASEIRAASKPFEPQATSWEPRNLTEPHWPSLLSKHRGVQAALLALLVVTGLGWGTAIAALSALSHRTSAFPIAQASPGVASIADELDVKTHALDAISLQYRTVRAQLDEERRARRHRRDAPAFAAAQIPDPEGAAAARAATATAERSAGILRAQVHDVKADNAALEQNYNDLLASLHRTQRQLFSERQRKVAAAPCAPAR